MDRPTPPQQRAVLVLLLIALVVVIMVLRPLAKALLLATVLAAALAPLQIWLSKRLRGHQRISAIVVVLGLVVVVLAPLVSLVAFLIGQASAAVAWLSETLRTGGVEGLVNRLPEVVQGPATSLLGKLQLAGADLGVWLEQQVTERSSAAAAAVGSIVAATGSVAFQVAMMLIALYFFLAEREAVLGFIQDSSPLGTEDTRELMREFQKVTVAVLRSTLLTALIEAIAALLGLVVVGAPYPGFFATITFFAAMIPGVGAGGAAVVVGGLLLLAGHPISAAVYAGWGLLTGGLVDNVVKPILMKNDVDLDGTVIFFSLIGGLITFGPVGLLIGPLAMSFFVAVQRMYRREYGSPGAPAPPRHPPEMP